MGTLMKRQVNNSMDKKFDKLIEAITNENNKDYSVSELLDKLLKDESWEPNPQKRFQTIMMLKAKLNNA